jgi:hypothetical protein
MKNFKPIQLVSQLRFKLDTSEKHIRIDTTSGDSFSFARARVCVRVRVRARGWVGGPAFLSPHLIHSINQSISQFFMISI